MDGGRVRGEEDLVRRIARMFPSAGRQVTVSLGDDAAVLRLAPSRPLVVTTDQLVEGVHFRRATHPPELLGEKAVSVNLSDLAAMGASPRWALMSLFLPPDLSAPYLEEVLRGMARRCSKVGVELVGGNLTSSKVLALDVTLLGLLPAGVRPLRRVGARAGDSIYVSGHLGGSALGLGLLGKGWRWAGGRARKRRASAPAMRCATRALRKHFCPEPELELGLLLARHRLASAAMDLSDGLSLDLRRLCRASGVGARILSGSLPLDPAALQLAGERNALGLALNGGEDYRLLFTVPPGRATLLRRLVSPDKLHPIGRIVPLREGVKLVDEKGRAKPLTPLGYDHLKAAHRGKARRRG